MSCRNTLLVTWLRHRTVVVTDKTPAWPSGRCPEIVINQQTHKGSDTFKEINNRPGNSFLSWAWQMPWKATWNIISAGRSKQARMWHVVEWWGRLEVAWNGDASAWLVIDCYPLAQLNTTFHLYDKQLNLIQVLVLCRLFEPLASFQHGVFFFLFFVFLLRFVSFEQLTDKEGRARMQNKAI